MKNYKTEKRFSGDLSQEYALNELVFPHQKKVHELVGAAIRSHIGGKSANCLEIGCGTGVTTRAILDSNPGLHLAALDSSSEMIKQARNYLGSQKIEWIESDALNYLSRIRPESIDVVASAYVFHNFPAEERIEVLEKVYGSLKPGGLLINADIIYSSNQEERDSQFNWLAGNLSRYDKLGRPDLKKKWMRHISEDRDASRILIDNEFIFQLNKIGFKSIERRFRSNSDAVYTAVKQ